MSEGNRMSAVLMSALDSYTKGYVILKDHNAHNPGSQEAADKVAENVLEILKEPNAELDPSGLWSKVLFNG